MGKCLKVAIAGLGSRGRDTYAKTARLYPDKMKIVAAADIDPKKLKLMAEEYGIPDEACFNSAEAMLERERLADVMIIATQDRQHVGHAIPALEKGYHILLEKPVSPDLSECEKLLETAKRCGRKVVVCHVLRYTPLYRKAKELLDAGEIGEVVSIAAIENVGWYHQAHSFVRGNWANSDETSPMILQKCCHDMDLYPWLAGKTCDCVSSFGSTWLFKKENAPEGCSERCLGGCQVKESCPFDAESIYLNHAEIGWRTGNKFWPLDVLVPEGPDEERIMEALRTGRYGRCVYHCDNNVVDHQVVNLHMTDGATMSFTMCGFTQEMSRDAKFMGTKGEMQVYMGAASEDSFIAIRKFDSRMPEEYIRASELSDDFSGHGGGDIVMVEEFLDILSGEKEESACVTSLERSLESHYCALAAEYSRTHGGMTVKLKDFLWGGANKRICGLP